MTWSRIRADGERLRPAGWARPQPGTRLRSRLRRSNTVAVLDAIAAAGGSCQLAHRGCTGRAATAAVVDPDRSNRDPTNLAAACTTCAFGPPRRR